jgi:hypothetical protein
MDAAKRKLTEASINKMHAKYEWWQIKRCTRQGQKVYDVALRLPAKNKGEKPQFVSAKAIDLYRAIDEAMAEADKVL